MRHPSHCLPGWGKDVARCLLTPANDHHEEFVRSHQRDCGPRCRCGADQAVGPALGHVHGERGGDAEREHPAGQPRYRQPVPRRVQDDHRRRVHQAVNRPGLQQGGHAALAVLAGHCIGVPVRDVRRDPCYGEHDGRRGRADRALPLTAGRRGSSAVPADVGSGPGPDWLSSRVDMLFPPRGRGGAGQLAATRASRPLIKAGTGYSVAARARSRTPAVVPTYMSSVMR